MITVHICEHCQARYDTPAKALNCENQVPSNWDEDRRPEVGDYVLCNNVASSYYDGDTSWAVERPGNPEASSHFEHYNGWLARWVVVATYVGRWHEQRYVLWTPSNRDGREQIATTSHQHMSTKTIGQASAEHLTLGKAAHMTHKGGIDIV